jgi:hypothetical protein
VSIATCPQILPTSSRDRRTQGIGYAPGPEVEILFELAFIDFDEVPMGPQH